MESEPLYLTHTHSHSIVAHSCEEEVVGAREKEATTFRISSYCFWGFAIGADSISEKFVGFSPLWFLEENLCVHCLMCLINVLGILSVKILS